MCKTNRYAVIVVLALLGGCHHAAKTPENAGMNQGAGGQAPGTPSSVATDELNNPTSPLAKRSVYFDFDAYDVKPEYQTLLQAHADYLRRHPSQRVLIQGNTDERGTSEYNLALGQRRSHAVMSALVTLGVPETQLEAVSFGKEKPVALGHDEASWSQNRRADMVYR